MYCSCMTKYEKSEFILILLTILIGVLKLYWWSLLNKSDRFVESTQQNGEEEVNVLVRSEVQWEVDIDMEP